MAMFADYRPRVEGMPSRSEVVIADAQDDDVEAVAEITREREGGTFEDAAERVRRWLSAPPESYRTLVARVEGKVAGYGRFAQITHRPPGWYLTGVVVAENFRRRGVAEALTQRRLEILRDIADEAYFFANSINRATIDLHAKFGFEEIQRPFEFSGCHFSGGGVGVLFRAQLRRH